MSDIQGIIMILASFLAIYLLARTIFLMVYRLVRKKPWVGKVLWWTTVLCGVAALFGPRHGSIFSSFAVLGMTVLLLPLLGKVRWGKPPKDSLNVRTESYDEALGVQRFHSVNPMNDDWWYR